ncbi:unnamed protein product [Rotaria socialis]|uniref:Transmembrane protein 69 n=1 Tax=Rotaria socialis TaxID=392032 RepID=A0A821C0R0_9BILA|nr:unnamed protein product [Rotaria socialis]CAF3520442.1 unnamed protein product [Rotaria socialis]CAF4551469.1 unnamed protein product [Rotaria socialis]CAF4603073.1 unnamed protein product [Rotaria socialis]
MLASFPCRSLSSLSFRRILQVHAFGNHTNIRTTYSNEFTKNELLRRHNKEHSSTYFDQFRYIRHIKDAPTVPLSFGLLGLVPFAAVPLYMYSTGVYSPDLAFTQLAYSASILSYIGGIRWGRLLEESNDWKQYAYAILPSIAAWLALLVPGRWSILWALTSFQGFAFYDVTRPGYPLWFKGLRVLLTAVSSLTLFATLTLSFVLRKKEAKTKNTNRTM